MKSVAVICEFNPFHNGHALLASEIKKAYPDHAVIAIMSGNTVQRGDFAIFDKYERAKIAVLNGFDAVVELPFPFSCSAGEQFARAGVCIANSLMASVLAFGSECGSIKTLTEYANNLDNPDFINSMNKYARSNRDTSVIYARENAYQNYYGKALPSGSNDILGIEYLRAINNKHYPIKAHVIHRTENFRATDARTAIRKGDISEKTRLLSYSENFDVNAGLTGISDFLLGAFRVDIRLDNGNGIINALKSCAKKAGSFDEFVSLLPTKTYTLARLRREMIAYLLGITDSDKNEKPSYTVLLAANKTGQQYLSEIKKSISMPVLTKYSDAREFDGLAKMQLEKAITADSIYCLGYNHSVTPIPFKTPYIEKYLL
jgi:predicted nucleotidyltransferase